ncbi:cation-translocating P-type ATPase [Candidatus Formimonas warabiya]|nr:HAD-IC family P-type ATPase [Candidatus Formimonas warabiya]
MEINTIKVVHYLPGRVRFRVPYLYRNQEAKWYLEKELNNLTGVMKAEANPWTASLLVVFDAASLSLSQLNEFLTRPLISQEEAAAATQMRPGAGKAPVSQHLPWAGLLLGGWWLSRNRSFPAPPLFRRPGRGLGLVAEIWGYSLLFEGITDSIRQKRFDPHVIVGAAALLATSTGLAPAGLAYLVLTQLTDAVRHSPGGDAPSRPAGQILLPSLAALLAFTLTGSRQRALIPLMAGYSLASGLTTALPQSALLNQGAPTGWVSLRPDTVSRSSGIDTVLFSSENLLSADRQEIKDIIPLDPNYSKEQVLFIGAAAYQHQEGTLARNLVHQVQIAQLPLLALENPVWERGKGIKGLLENHPVLVGNEKLMKGEGISLSSALPYVWRLKHLRQNPLYISLNHKLIGLIGIGHDFHPSYRDLVESLRAAGVARIGIFRDEHENLPSFKDSGLLEYGPVSSPDEKAFIIRQLQKAGHRVAVIGQEISDLAALEAANLSVVFSDVKPQLWNFAHLAVDFKDPRQLGNYFHQVNIFRQVVRQNTALVSAHTAVGSALGLAGTVTPWSALLLQVASGFLVAWNSRHRFPRSPQGSAFPAVQEVAATVVPLGLPAPGLAPSYPVPAESRYRPVQELAHRLQESRFLWHSLSGEEVVKLMGSQEQGLSGEEAALRRRVFSPNRLTESPGLSVWQLIKKQLGDVMVTILLGAAGFCLAAEKYTDAITIITILLINGLLGILQEIKAHKSLKALKKLTVPTAQVVREGRQITVCAEELVPGDLIVLHAGDRVPADAVLLRSVNLEAEESSLTGEAAPVSKKPGVTPPDTPLGERTNLLFMGTCITRGSGAALVVATGMATEVGKIAGMMISEEKPELTPLQQTLAGMNKFIVSACFIICAVIFSLGLLRGEGIFDMFLTAVSMAVAAIPEGLTAIVTIALTLGVYRMSKSNTIVRHLPTLETLGCANVICTDKTGTITKNEMTVREVFCGQEKYALTGDGYAPEGKLFLADREMAGPTPGLRKLFRAGVLCNNARLSLENGRWVVHGDTTEGALLTAGAKMGIKKEDLEKIYSRVEEIPFDADRRLMTVICRQPDGSMAAFSKGAPETILPSCASIWSGSAASPLNQASRKKILAQAEQMAGKAFRVMALAWKPLEDYGALTTAEAENNLIFCGLAGILDPPRPEVKGALAACQSAGVKVIIISGDHPLTVKAIAKEIGLSGASGNRLITGQELDGMDDAALAREIGAINLIARAAPDHKLRLVKALKQQGHVVVMTGDGVNDAPAVKEADIGVAMGINGTDLTKDVSALVLTDDHFATLVKAIKEGRSIFANIRHAIRYLVATNVGEVVAMLGATLLGMPLPLTPLLLLWLNLSGDGLPAIALVADPPDPNQMNHPPRKVKDGLFSGVLGKQILRRGLFIGLSTVAVFKWGLGKGIPVARSLALGVLGVSQFFHLFDCRKDEPSSPIKLLNNRYLLVAGFLGLLMVLAAIQLPGANRIFLTRPLFMGEWLVVWGISLITALLDDQGFLTAKKPFGQLRGQANV